ncbi:uncharacterized protein [Spinacia oleracea]|uniref:Uncharacterized protein isoform X2 n=1 Tax=Spinacia oleracea TaxID=3562 RepID=A0ABM3REZ0_SPIOL|nr:uncharacterized protein LOC110782351 isoform X2 [Spinacia oleracea]
MRKSFGGTYGGGGGGGGGANGGDMLRSVGRVVRTRLNNFQESLPSPNSSTTSSTNKSSSSTTTKTKKTSSKHALSLSSATPLPVSAAWVPSPSYLISNDVVNDDDNDDNNVVNDDNNVVNEWECLENYYDPIFGVVPSTLEVQHVLFSLRDFQSPLPVNLHHCRVIHPNSCSQSTTDEEISCDVDIEMDEQTKTATETLLQRTLLSSKGSDTDWIEPSMVPYDWKLTQSPGWGRVHDAFGLLQSEPSVQRMVVSLSSDKAVWDAVLNNEAVRQIRDSYRDAAELLPPSSEEKSDSSKGNLKILQWIFVNMKIKLLEALGNISRFVGDLFKPVDCDKEEQSYAFTEKLKSTFLLTVVVLLIVVVARGHRA